MTRFNFRLLIMLALAGLALLNLSAESQAAQGNLSGARLLKTLGDENLIIQLIAQPSRQFAPLSTDSIEPTAGIALLHFAGLARLQRRDWAEAASFFEIVWSRQPTRRIDQFYLAWANYKLGNRVRAVELWRSPSSVRFLVWLGERAEQEELTSGADWYRLAIQVGSGAQSDLRAKEGLALAYRGLGVILRAKGQIPEAIKMFNAALENWPERADYRYDLAQLYMQEGDAQRAQEQLAIVIKMQPDVAAWVCAMGEIYFWSDRATQAEQAFRRCLGMGSDENDFDRNWHARARMTLSVIYNQRQEFAQSVPMSLTAIRLNGGLDSSWTTWLEQNLTDALGADSARLEWYVEAGDAFIAAGNPAAAKRIYEMASTRWNDTILRERLREIQE